MELDWLYVLAIVGGFFAGVVNTLAGSGSLITLPIFMVLGLDANVANGTNRVGLLAQSFTSTLTFWRKGMLNYKGMHWLIIPTMIGGFVGSEIAARADASVMKQVIAYIMILMLFVILLNPKKWLDTPVEIEKKMNTVFFILMVGLGSYGGFIQVGTGIFLLISLVMAMNYAVVKANAIKNLIILCFNIPAILNFIRHDQVDWKLGLLVTIGQVGGAFVAAKFASESKNAAVWIKRLLVVVIVLASLKLLGVLDFFSSI